MSWRLEKTIKWKWNRKVYVLHYQYERVQYHATNFMKKKKDESLWSIKNHTFKGKHRESTIKGPPDMPNQGTELYERVQYYATNLIKKKKDEGLWSSPCETALWWYSIVTKSTTLWTGIGLQSPFVIMSTLTFSIILKFSFSNSFVNEFVLISRGKCHLKPMIMRLSAQSISMSGCSLSSLKRLLKYSRCREAPL